MNEAKTLSVTIVTWNSRQYLPNVFASIKLQSFRDTSVTVVDNASQDGTVAWLHEAQPSAVVLRNFRNQGFARGHNQGIALALARWSEADWPRRYILIANPDLEFAPECHERLVAEMESDVGLAACGPKLLRAHAVGQEEGRMVTIRTNIIDSAGMVISKSRRVTDRGAGEEDRGHVDRDTDVFGLSGACLCVRASAIAESKIFGEFFDEDFFAYKEDVDLAWRMRRLGMRVRFVPRAVAWHVRTAPSLPSAGPIGAWRARAQKPSHINFYSTRNHLWTIWKNDDPLTFLRHSAHVVPYELAKAFASLFSLAVFKGNLAAAAGLVRMLRKRRELFRRTRASRAAMRQWFV